MSSKQFKRQRRAKKARAIIAKSGMPRLVVNKTNQHIYANVMVLDNKGSRVAASASTLEKELRGKLQGAKTEKAKMIGKVIAERIKNAGIKQLAFDRSGYKYHGRIKALADAIREEEIQI